MPNISKKKLDKIVNRILSTDKAEMLRLFQEKKNSDVAVFVREMGVLEAGELEASQIPEFELGNDDVTGTPVRFILSDMSDWTKSFAIASKITGVNVVTGWNGGQLLGGNAYLRTLNGDENLTEDVPCFSRTLNDEFLEEMVTV